MIEPFKFSYGSSSGVNGDTTSGGAADYYFSAPFAVGSGASASASQAGGGTSAMPWLIGAAAVVFLALLARFR